MMAGTRSLLRAALIFGLGLGLCVALVGCSGGDATDTSGNTVLTDAQKAEQAARSKETADYYKDAQKTKKKK